ncbi:MAG: hypothetical protein JO027_05730 [Solirubrobacterales bacterium]|nr:hypothetical protein [Solirubrobacterales bacterium]
MFGGQHFVDARASLLRRVIAGLSTIVALAALGSVVLPVASAQASIIDLSACNLSPLSQPFAPWLDSSSYELAPGGDFESASWNLSGGAARVPGSDPFAATGALGSWSLSLPAGASAQSPATCVDAAYPTVRFFASGTGLLAVTAVYGDVTLPAGVDVVAGGWSPSPVMLTSSALVALTSDGSAQVSLRFTTLVGDVRVDDVFVDPWNRS